MKAEIEKNFPEIQIMLIKGSGGVFEVEKEGQLIFSKKQSGRFPEHDEILAKLS